MSERNAQIVALARAGESYRIIAAKFGLTGSRVGQIVNPVLGHRGGRSVTSDERKVIVDAARRGLCVAHIAKDVGRHWKVVRGVLEAAGVKAVSNGDVFGPEARALAVELVRGGATYQEAAEATGMTREAVAGACYRARKAMEVGG